jgi:hypothetical protein
LHEATTLGLAAYIADARNDTQMALSNLNQAIAIAEPAGATRVWLGHTLEWPRYTVGMAIS